jgi:hypothetical protein
MCSLCGILGCDDHWTHAVKRPGVFTRNDDAVTRRAESARRVAAANRVLSWRRLKLAEWERTSYVVTSATGASSVFEAFSHLWPEAEAIAGREFDPLDDALIDWVSRR